MSALTDFIQKGKLPEVPVTIESRSLINLGLTIGIVAMIILLSSYLLKKL